MNYRFAVACLFAAIPQLTNAHKACSLQFAMQVTEKHTGLPIAGATLYLNNGGLGYTTNESGTIRIDSLCPAQYTWLIQADGQKFDTGTIFLVADTLVKVKMFHLARALQQIIVRDERVPTILQSKETLSKLQLEEGAGKSLAQLLQQVNGVNLFSNGGTVAKPVIHGLRNNRILTLNNGVRQEDQQWGDEHAPNIDPFLANNITVIKGAAGVRYGSDAIGGVILVEPAPLRAKPGWDGEVNVGAFSNNRMGVAEAMVEHAFKRFPGLAVRVQGTLKKGGNYRIPGYWAANTGIAETNYSAAAVYRRAHLTTEVFYSHFNTELGFYRGSETGSRQDLLNAINSDTPLVYAGFSYKIERPKQRVTHDLFKLKLNAETIVGRFSLTYAYQHNFRQEYDVTRAQTDNAQLNLTLNTQTLNLNLDQKQIGNFTGQVGLDGIYQDNFFKNGDRLFIPAYKSYGGGAYAVERWRQDHWTIEGGLRFDDRHYDVVNFEGTNQQPVKYSYSYNSISSTLGINRQLAPGADISVTASTAWRAPQSNELFSAGLHGGSARLEMGDKNLLPERAYGLNAEGKWVKNKFSAEVSLYSQYIKDYIYLEPGADLLTIRGYYKTFQYKQTNAWLNGADITSSFQWIKSLETTLKASFLFARNTSANDWLILIPPDRISMSTRYSYTFSNHIKDCFLEVEGNYVFRQNRIPANFDAIDYPRPPSDYFLLAASVGSTIMAAKQPIILSLSLENALNTRYREYLDAFRYFIDQPGTNLVFRLRFPINNH